MKTYLILIADDEPANIQIIVEALSNSDLNHKVIRATNGKILCELAEKRLPDLIITDWEMPEMDGIEAIKVLKSTDKTKDIPVIMCTGIMTTSENLKLALMSGAVDYIRKPVNPIELEARVRSMLQLNESYLLIKEQKDKIHQQKNELEALNETKDRFFNIIAHDLRGPIFSFLGLSELLAKEIANYKSKQILKLVSILKNSASNISQLLENLLEWSKVQRNLIDVSFEKTQPYEIVNFTVDLLQAENNGLKICNQIPPDLTVCVDLHLFQTVIRNLISNAMKFTEDTGCITISAESVLDNKIILSVKDTGIGMNQIILDSLFKLDSKMNRRGIHNEPSSGLGLILCKDLVEKMNGEFWVESEENQGSTFYIKLNEKCH